MNVVSPDLEARARIVELRERYVGFYLSHLLALSSMLHRAVTADVGLVAGSSSRLNGELSVHLATTLARLNDFMGDVRRVALDDNEVEGAMEFVDSLAREAMHSYVSQLHVDVTRIARYRVEGSLGALEWRSATQAEKRHYVANFITKNIYSMDSLGRHLRSERYVRGLLNVALFRARNEVYAAAHAAESLVMYRPGHEPVKFTISDYGRLVGSLHPFSEPIIFIDNRPSKTV